MGRKTYDIFAAYWPYAADGPDAPIAEAFNKVTKYVASRSTRRFDWNNSQWLGEDTVASLKKIKAGDGPDLLIQGSSDLIQTLLKHGLIDEFTVLVFPLLLGKGKRLFGEGTVPSGLKWSSRSPTRPASIVATYRPDGEVKTGSFASEEPSPAELERRKNLT